MSKTVVHRFQCALIFKGCETAVILPDMPQEDLDALLKLNGWWLDHSKWVCHLHEEKPCPFEHEPIIKGE